MKKLYKPLRFAQLFFLSALIGLPLFCAAQESEEENPARFKSGIRLGFSGCQIFGDGVGGYNKLGYVASALVSTKLKENLNIQMELGYSNRGSNDPARPDKGKINSYRYNIHYIDIPVVTNFWIWKFNFEAGICNGIYIAHRETSEQGRVLVNEELGNFSRYDLSGVVGIIYPFSDKWSGNVRFQNSILPSTKGGLQWIAGFGIAGGMYHNIISFSVVRHFSAK